MWQWVATIAMWLMETSYLPQVVRLYRLKEAEEFSLLFPLMNLSGRLLLMFYTYSRGEYVLVWGFLGGLTLRGTLLLQVLYYRWRRRYYDRLRNTTLGL